MSKKTIERGKYLKRLRQLKDQNLIKVITGIRRCGKSTLLEEFNAKLGYVNALKNYWVNYYKLSQDDPFRF